jgi:hypothetical protein
VIIRLTDKVKIKEDALYYFNNERVGRWKLFFIERSKE